MFSKKAKRLLTGWQFNKVEKECWTRGQMALSLTDCIHLGKAVNLSEPQFSHL